VRLKNVTLALLTLAVGNAQLREVTPGDRSSDVGFFWHGVGAGQESVHFAANPDHTITITVFSSSPFGAPHAAVTLTLNDVTEVVDSVAKVLENPKKDWELYVPHITAEQRQSEFPNGVLRVSMNSRSTSIVVSRIGEGSQSYFSLGRNKRMLKLLNEYLAKAVQAQARL
jgi:hypothetical protein